MSTPAEPPCPDDDNEIVACWCGAKGTYADLFDEDGMDEGCGGHGVRYCHCGGDICVCHNHGEIPCFGCPDCRDEGEDDYDGDW